MRRRWALRHLPPPHRRNPNRHNNLSHSPYIAFFFFFQQIQCKGISSLTSVDFEYAKMMRSTIKLLGTAMLSPDGEKLSVFVSPVLVPLRHPIASARGAGNIVSVDSKVCLRPQGGGYRCRLESGLGSQQSLYVYGSAQS